VQLVTLVTLVIEDDIHSLAPLNEAVRKVNEWNEDILQLDGLQNIWWNVRNVDQASFQGGTLFNLCCHELERGSHFERSK
jgi:hypothetical protein